MWLAYTWATWYDLPLPRGIVSVNYNILFIISNALFLPRGQYYAIFGYALTSNMEKKGYGCNKHESFDALMDFYEKGASEYDEVSDLRKYLTYWMIFNRLLH